MRKRALVVVAVMIALMLAGAANVFADCNADITSNSTSTQAEGTICPVWDQSGDNSGYIYCYYNDQFKW